MTEGVSLLFSAYLSLRFFPSPEAYKVGNAPNIFTLLYFERCFVVQNYVMQNYFSVRKYDQNISKNRARWCIGKPFDLFSGGPTRFKYISFY